MSTYNTGNPLGSAAPKDLFDNAENLDLAANDLNAVAWRDRFGRNRKTMSQMAREAQQVVDGAQQHIADAVARVQYPTVAAMNADANNRDKIAIVHSDAAANNGNYFWNGSGWIKTEIQPATKTDIGLIEDRIVPTEVKADEASFLAVPRILSEKFAWAVMGDQNDQPILGVQRNGYAYALLDKMPGLSSLSQYAWAMVDENNVVVFGVKWSGEVTFIGSDTGGALVYEDGPDGNRQVWAMVNDVPHQLTDEGDNFGARSSYGQVTYLNRNGATVRRTVDIPPYGAIAPYVEGFEHVVHMGQSLDMGSQTTPQTLQPTNANRLYTLKGGIRLANQDDTLSADSVYPFKPLVSESTEPPIVQQIGQLSRNNGIPKRKAVLASLHGRGGYTVAQLSKGSLYYANMMTAVTYAKAYCDSLGLTYRVPAVGFIQGEANRLDAAGVYSGQILALQSDLALDIQAVSGQSVPPILVVDQISNWTSYGMTQSDVPFDQLNAAIENPGRIVCAGPKYWVPTVSDGTHLQSRSSMRIGAMRARALEAVMKGYQWFPTHCTSIRRSDEKLVMTFHTPSGTPLTIDTRSVSDPGNFGLRLIGVSNSASINSIRLTGNNELTVSLSAIPTGSNMMVGIADVGVSGAGGGPTSGPRSNIRDQSSDFDSFSEPIFNWACHQRISFQ